MAPRDRRLTRLLPVMMVGFLVIPELIWIARDHSVWGWDQAEYGSTSITLYATLRLHTHDWVQAMIHALPWKSPGTTWIGQFFVPLHSIVGSYERALLLSIVACQAGSITMVFAAARRLGATAAGSLAGALALAGAPLFVVMGRTYYVEPLQTFCVAWVLFIMASAPTWRRSLTLTQLAAAISLGLLAKISTPFYMAAPIAVVLYFAIRKSPEPSNQAPWRDWRVVASAVIAVVLITGAAAWYGQNIHDALHHANAAAARPQWGHNAPLATKTIAWTTHLARAMFQPHFGLLLLGLLAASLLIAYRRGGFARLLLPRGLDARRAHIALSYAATVTTVIVVVVLLSLQTTDVVRFITPLTACGALLIAGLISATRPRVVSIAALGLLGGQFALSNFQSNGPGLGGTGGETLRGPKRDRIPTSQLHALAKLTCTSNLGGNLTVVVPRFGSFHSPALELAAQEDYALSGDRCSYYWPRSRGHDAQWAWSEIERLDPLFVISLDYENPGNPLPHQVDPAVSSKHQLDSGPEVLRLVRASGKFTVVPGSQHGDFVVLRARPAQSQAGA